MEGPDEIRENYDFYKIYKKCEFYENFPAYPQNIQILLRGFHGKPQGNFNRLRKVPIYNSFQLTLVFVGVISIQPHTVLRGSSNLQGD